MLASCVQSSTNLSLQGPATGITVAAYLMHSMACPKHTAMPRILAPCAVHLRPLYKRPASRGTFIFSSTRAPSGIVCHQRCPSFRRPCFGGHLQSVCLLPKCLGLPPELAAVQWNLHTYLCSLCSTITTLCLFVLLLRLSSTPLLARVSRTFECLGAGRDLLSPRLGPKFV